MHPVYWAPHKLRGTQPSAKTRKRLELQASIGLNPYAREIVRDDGSIIHPTKGFGSYLRRKSRVTKNSMKPSRQQHIRNLHYV